MSLILDALNKADRERQNTNTLPGLNTEHADIPEIEQGFNFKTLIPIPIVLLLCLAFWFVWQNSGAVSDMDLRNKEASPRSTVNKEASPQYKEASPQYKEASPEFALNKEPPPKIKNTEELAAKIPQNSAPPKPSTINQPSPQLAATVNTQTKPDYPGLTKPLKMGSSDRASTRQPKGSTTPNLNALYHDAQVVQNETQQKVVQPIISAVKEIPDNTLQESIPPVNPEHSVAAFPDIPTLAELPLSVQNKIPTLRYTHHAFTQPGSGRITINQQTKKDGDRLSGDVVIEKILQDGVILRTGEHQFKMYSLNSWINM